MMLPFIKYILYALCHAFDIFDHSCHSFMAGITDIMAGVSIYYFTDEENEAQKLNNLHK